MRRLVAVLIGALGVGTAFAAPLVAPAAHANDTRRALVMLWDTPTGTSPGTDSVVLSGDQITQSATRFSGPGSQIYLDVPADLTVGDHPVRSGGADGAVALYALAGGACYPAAGSSVTVHRSEPLPNRTYAALSLDADLDCGGWGRLHVQLRWDDSTPVRALAASTTVVEAAPGSSADGAALVTNTGTAAWSVVATDLVADGVGSPAGLAVTGTDCVAVLPGDSCRVELQFAPSADRTAEARAVLGVRTEAGTLEVLVIGQLPGSAAEDVAVHTGPGSASITWRLPAAVDSRRIAGYRVEELTASGRAVRARPLASATSANLGRLDPGVHRFEVTLLTTDGRELSSGPAEVSVPTTWLLLATTSGVRAANPAEAFRAGEAVGTKASTSSLAVAADRHRAIAVTDSVWTSRLVTVSATDEQQWIEPRSTPDSGLDVSPDGRTAVLRRDNALRLLDLDGTVTRPVPGSSGLGSPVWTPDGSALVAWQGDLLPLVRLDPRTGARTTIPGTEHATTSAISRTGRLVFHRWPEGDLAETPLSGGTARTLLTGVTVTSLAFDPTGRYLALGVHPLLGATGAVYDLATTPPTLIGTPPASADVAWWSTVSAAPTVAPRPGAWSGADPQLPIVVDDPDDAVGGVALTCRLDDSGGWTACASPWRPGPLNAGPHTVHVRGTDPAGNLTTASATWQVDTGPPTAAVLAPLPSATLSAAVPLAWSANDTGSGVASFDVRWRAAAPSALALGQPVSPAGLQRTVARSTTLSLAPGAQACFSARARDRAGNLGSWGAEQCTSVLLDDRALAATRWARGASSGHALGTFTRTTTPGAVLSRAGLAARRVGLVVTTCPTCGSVDVRHAGRLLGRVDLRSTTTRTRQLRWLTVPGPPRAGTLTITAVSTRLAIIDGIVVGH